MTTLKELVLANRSYRGYDESRRITREELLEMVDCARLTASSVNHQPLKFCLVCEKEPVRKIQSYTQWAKGLRNLTLPHPGKCPTAFIVICLDVRIDPNAARYQRDVGVAAQTILLKSTEMGLGGCMIGSYNAAGVKEALALPEHLTPQLVIAIGKPAETVVLTEPGPDGSVAYYRDENDIHYVPKRALADIVL
ncbi:MAG: nitroreductase family protein [Lachnospiraceae bacterium]|nr:nitroreductase family protein [Lachnospiraceae bacterium]